MRQMRGEAPVTPLRRRATRRPMRSRRAEQAQSVVEMTLCLPILLLLLFGAIDFARYAYTRSTLENNVQGAARAMITWSNQGSDCAAFSVGMSNGGAITLSADPHAVNTTLSFNPTAAGSITTNTGYVYIFPAVSTATPQYPGNCAGANRPAGTTCQVQITYVFKPWTPALSSFLPNGVNITASASLPSEY